MRGYEEKLQKELNKTIAERDELKKEQEYITFLYQELEAANLQENEQIELEEELEQLNNVELIKENLDKMRKTSF